MADIFDPRLGLSGDPTPLDIASPEYDAQISGRGADPTHHIKLIDGEGSSVGFVITDQAGDLDERTFRRFPSSDPQNPYIQEKQPSFGGGFGQSTFEENRAKYWRSEGVDTTKDVIALGPMFHYARGAHSKAREYMPIASHKGSWVKVVGDKAWVAMDFTPDQQWTKSEYLKIWLLKGKDTTRTLRIRLYTSSAGKPNTLIHTEDVLASSVTHSHGEWFRIDIDDTYTYAADTKYHVVITTTGTGTNHWWVWGYYGGGGYKSTDGSTWTSGPQFYFRIEGNRTPGTHNFFEYKKQLYWLTKFDAYSTSIMMMNGWRGVADSNSADKTDLYDSTQNWSGKITGDEVVQMYAGKATGEQEDRRGVVSGSGGNLVCDRDWEITHTNQDEYVITNSDWAFAIDGESMLGGRVSDAAVSQGLLYVCRGNNRYIRVYEGYRNSSGAWAQRWRTIGAKAQFVRAVNDPIAGDIIWFGHNRSVSGAYKPYVWYSEPTSYDADGIDLVHLGSNSGDGQSWTVAGGSQVTVTNVAAGQARILVMVGEATGATVNAAGENYVQGDDITVTNPDNTDTMLLNVDTVGGSGEVTAVSILDGGYDFDVATGQATNGGSGTGCTIDVDVVSTFEGDIAYLDLKNTDGSARTVDLRNMTKIWSMLTYNTLYHSPNELASGDIRLKLSDSVALGNVIATNSMVGLTAGEKYPKSYGTLTSLSLASTAGSNSIASIGLNVNTGQGPDRSFYFIFSGQWIASRDRSPVEVGLVDGDNITGLQAYGDPETAWVMTEAGFGQIKNNKFLPVPQREVKTARHANNGIGNEVSDVYLLFTWKGRLQRYYRQNMEDLGPDFPTGMVDIAGDIVSVVTYPGRVYAAIDGGTTASSVIMCHKGGAWHEVFTSFTGERIRKLFIQPIEGHPDKLWASVGGDVMWFPIILNAAELPANSGYTYRPMGYLDTSWIYTEDRDLNKVFRSFLLSVDDAEKYGPYRYYVHYKVDEEDADWIRLTKREILSFSTMKYPMVLEDSPEARGNRVKFRIQMMTRYIDKSPIVRSITTRIYRVPEVKYIYSWLSKVSAISINLRGDEERAIGTQATTEAAMNKLDTWAENLTILRTDSDIAAVNNRSVVIEPVPFQLLMMVHDESIQEESIQMSANEVD